MAITPPSSLKQSEDTPVRRSPRLLRQQQIQNSSTAYVPLNPDIWRQVFILLGKDLSRNDSDWKWFALSHVCRQWRAIAHHTSEFWSNIVWDFTSMNMVTVQLSLSRNAKLSISFIQRKYRVIIGDLYAVFDAILQHKHRIADIHIQVHENLWEYFEDFTASLPSELNVLHLQLIPKQRLPLHTRKELNLTDILLLKQLQKLYIHDFILKPFKITPVQNLVDLTFYRTQLEPFESMTIMYLFPNLKNLSLLHCSLNYHKNQYSKEQLSPLRNLTIYGQDSTEVYMLFKSFRQPKNTNWDLECTDVTPLFRLRPMHTIFGACGSIVNYLFDPFSHCKSLYVSMTDIAILFRSSGNVLEWVEHENIAEVISLRFKIEGRGLSYVKTKFHTAIRNVISRTQCGTAETFHLHFQSAEDMISKGMWADLLNSFKNLSMLEITLIREGGYIQKEFARGLKLYTRDKKDKPSLKILSLHLTQYDTDFIKELKETLLYMKNNGEEIAELNISYPTEVSSALIEGISKCVQRLNVNIDPSLAQKRKSK